MKKHLFKDPIMAKIIRNEGDLPKIAKKSVFTALVSSIISQQVSIEAADAIFTKVCNHFGTRRLKPELIFGTDQETLRTAGLSRQKASYVLSITDFFMQVENKNIKWSKLTDEEIISKLTEIKGIGKWTVQMLLMFTLGREDVFPSGDLGIQLAMKECYDLKQEKKALIIKMEEIAEQWSPYRTLASRYLWTTRRK